MEPKTDVKKKVKRTSFGKQREICRADDTAYYEEVNFESALSDTKGGGVSVGGKRFLMCGRISLRGGQCMAKKCVDFRIIPEPVLVPVPEDDAESLSGEVAGTGESPDET